MADVETGKELSTSADEDDAYVELAPPAARPDEGGERGGGKETTALTGNITLYGLVVLITMNFARHQCSAVILSLVLVCLLCVICKLQPISSSIIFPTSHWTVPTNDNLTRTTSNTNLHAKRF